MRDQDLHEISYKDDAMVSKKLLNQSSKSVKMVCNSRLSTGVCSGVIALAS